MKKLIVPKVMADISKIEDIDEKLAGLPFYKIDKINWPEEYPSKPEVSFGIAHNGDNIFLQYKVHENEILGMITHDNGEVWTDSCVEFFISFDDLYYYNMETSCIGKTLLGYRKPGDKAIHGSDEIMHSIKRFSSLGTRNRERESGDFYWTMTLVIPYTAYWNDNIGSFDGIKAKGNFYKCGDNLTVPHFVSWTEITTPQPSFHQPAYFGEIEFEG